MQISGSETDEILAVASAAGVQEAFALLVRRHGGRVQLLLNRLISDYHAAGDLSQEVWIKVYRSLGRFDARRRFEPWLLQIAMNHGRDALRKVARSPLHASVDAENSPPVAVEDPSESLLERAEIEHALDQVAEPFREALVLIDVLGLTYQEAAEALGCALGTVKSRVGRGRGLFRDHYGVQAAGASGKSRPGASKKESESRPSSSSKRASWLLSAARFGQQEGCS